MILKTNKKPADIIDFEKQGNHVLFFLGDSSRNYMGDDWDDVPYEHNAGPVYDQYVTAVKDIVFPHGWKVLEPCSSTLNSEYSKNDMKSRHVPCIIAVPPKAYEESCGNDSFDYWLKHDQTVKFYFGDDISEKIKNLHFVRV